MERRHPPKDDFNVISPVPWPPSSAPDRKHAEPENENFHWEQSSLEPRRRQAEDRGASVTLVGAIKEEQRAKMWQTGEREGKKHETAIKDNLRNDHVL